MANKIDLSGRTAVVTGGAQGIGRAIAARLLESGATVAIWDRDRAMSETAAGELGPLGKVVAVAVRRHRPGRGRGGARRHRQSARRHRHPGQQRRHRRAEPADLGVSAGGLGAGDGGQPRQACSCAAARGAADDRAELRPHRQHRLDRRQGGQPERGRLFGVEGRRHRADQVARQGAGGPRHRGQLPSRRRRRGPRSSSR